MNDKITIRNEATANVQAFLASGGKIETLPTRRRKVKMVVRVKSKTVFTSKEPAKGPSMSWGLLNGVA